jgi:hypothetical protein
MRHTVIKGRAAIASEILRPAALLLALATACADTLIVFAKLQSPVNGEFATAGLSSVNWTLFFVILGIGVVLTSVCCVLARIFEKRSVKENS